MHQPPQPMDEWSQRLRAKVRKDRGRYYFSLGSLIFLLLAAAAGLFWWFMPRGEDVRLVVVAFDQVAPVGEQPQLHAQVEPIEGPAGELTGLTVAFLEARVLLQAGDQLQTVKTFTFSRGQAVASMNFPQGTRQAQYLARLVGDRRRPTSEDPARVYFLDPETKLLLVDVRDLLADPDQDFGSADLPGISPNQEAARTLKELAAQNYQMIYLALDSTRAQDYRQQRRWLESKSQVFPPGPVLGRASYHQRETEDRARQQLYADLARNFSSWVFKPGSEKEIQPLPLGK